jgi:hypothetical protein
VELKVRTCFYSSRLASTRAFTVSKTARNCLRPGPAPLEFHHRRQQFLWPRNLDAVFHFARKACSGRRLLESAHRSRRYPLGARADDHEPVGIMLDVLAYPFAQLSSPSKGDEPQAVPAVGKRRDLLDLNQLRNKREAVLGRVEIRKHPLDRCADGNRLSNTLTHFPPESYLCSCRRSFPSASTS